jgi:predicted nucleic acid-binding protein
MGKHTLVSKLRSVANCQLSVCPILYGEIRYTLASQGTPIGNMDLLVAAHAKALKATLVTNNTVEFSRVPGLIYENWAT